ncbi:hypothetical protein A2661_02895 [Candidatus Giovannonibacteria bacterium RIFCSPHIGHO2_01_FULL_45_24]|uniref:alanine--tRNA ligase n=1 Tax=Candidatus Giovannonibacteria bacterium RIFCSPLOWO2_01_FULL_46_32 TaxID=1798353 RepID=A0A1F5XGH4_9BACT|nr:MAG: hypothetical protein A2661_02895 [Candidatus Giovannonibacteria bacterium RIFCSPHIGHO2_01_FULL_45_24]OGF86960.1 MAG: hypothetical protein A3B19_00815 [Candidatus Giovannonibacteria bacterium RIFCSPLOWO2_01_FULL_46_32]
MSSAELRKKFLDFFKKRGHKIAPSSSLIPDDPSVLLTTAGMQQFKKYYTEPSLAPAPNVASVQKCFRTSDIDEVGDESHLTFFEMLGNFSFGGYFKEKAIKYAKEFLESIGLKIDYVTVLNEKGDIEPDKESEEIWRRLGIKDIRKAGREDNFWGPTGAEGPCGPTTEIYINGVEIWNIVFNEYYKKPDGSFEKLKTPGVDTGMGLERLAMVSQGKKNIFETDLFAQYFELLPKELPEKIKRIIVDHSRAITFLINDGVRPLNKEAGYVLRRLIRRVMAIETTHNLKSHIFDSLLHDMAHSYGDFYPELLRKSNNIQDEIQKERAKFGKSLDKGIQEMKKDIQALDEKRAFDLYQTYGLPFEVIKDVVGGLRGSELNRNKFEEEIKKHQKISRAGVEKKFGGHGLLLDTGELKAKDEEELKKVIRLHTATHLLQAALRKVLGDGVKQAGSDITAERIRFDFTYDRKLTDEEIKKIEGLVNLAISKKYQVEMKEISYEEALKAGALHFFKEKYPENVKVYSVGDFRADPPEIFSRELCGGPHVKNTSEIGQFKILKQEAIGSGARRLRAIVMS